MAQKELRGVIPALITPMKQDGSVDWKSMEANVDYLSKAGVHGFFVNGTTAEGPILTRSEKREAVRLVKEVSGGKQTICAACIAPAVSLVLEEVADIAPLEPDYIVCVAPFYYPVPQRVIIDHFTRICASTDIPVIFYDIPQHTHNPVELPTRLALVESGSGAGFKDSSGDFVAFSRSILGTRRKDFAWIQGDDLLDGYSMGIGAKGVVSGLSNITPKHHLELIELAERGEFAQLLEIQKKINRLAGVIPAAGGRVIAGIKAATARLGRGEPWLRHTGLTVDERERAAVFAVIDELGELVSSS